MGSSGAALATVLSQAVSVVLSYFITRRRWSRRTSDRILRPGSRRRGLFCAE
jgi:Na+-driven multidrug efflux pump